MMEGPNGMMEGPKNQKLTNNGNMYEGDMYEGEFHQMRSSGVGFITIMKVGDMKGIRLMVNGVMDRAMAVGFSPVRMEADTLETENHKHEREPKTSETGARNKSMSVNQKS
ncbi:hypothetical protein AMTR_s00062p00157320 [Amborella trichopoda]|uniref:Uncharacterized protein n=1 Tax=Amborella trichopoda TaxID=13333 RepID=U5DGU3_AMBTC|nr:hypothetical protein AMTR_s00062p00157320 [Amborella trichopoda]